MRKRFNSLPRIEQIESDSDKFTICNVAEPSTTYRNSDFGVDGSGSVATEETEYMKNSKNRRNISEKSKKAQPCIHDRQKHQQMLVDKKAHNNKNTGTTLNEIILPPPCTCPYFGSTKSNALRPAAVKIVSSLNLHEVSPLIPNNNNNQIAVSSCMPSSSIGSKKFVASLASSTSTTSAMRNSAPSLNLLTTPSNHHRLGGSHSTSATPATSPTPIPIRKLSFSTQPHTKSNSVVTWDTRHSQKSRRGSSFGGHQTTLLLTPNKTPILTSALRRSTTLRNHNHIINDNNAPTMSSARSIDNSVSNILDTNTKANAMKSAPCLFSRCGTVRSHHSRNSSVISRNSSRHGRIIRLEQKATKVLGVVFFTFVILWAPFFVLNLLPSICGDCEQKIAHWVFDVVTWLGYASSMVNPIFYTIFNKVFRQAFKKVLMCQYGETKWRPQR